MQLNFLWGMRRRMSGRNPITVAVATVCALLVVDVPRPVQAWTLASNQVLVTQDMGGPVEARMRRVEKMRAKGEGVAVPYGKCISACTLYLSLASTCVGPNAIFGFHGPAAATSGLGLPFDEFERVSRAMAAYYPTSLQSWFLTTGRYLTMSYYTVSGAQLIQMGVKECA